MRTKRRVAFVLASAAAVGVGLVAFSASAGAVPPTCTPVASTGNDSCVKLQVAPSNPHGTFVNSSLFVRTRTTFDAPGNCAAGGCTNNVQLLFDSQFSITPGTIPTCSAAQLAGKNIATAWTACGPGGTHNAYLSPPGAVSGQASTVPPANLTACTLVFNGPKSGTNPTITLYARAPETAAACAGNPATNTGGSTTVVLSGTITNAGVAGFGKKLTVPNIDSAPLALDDFYATIKRGNYFRAKCPAGTSPWTLRGIFHYSGTGQANDTVNSTQACS